MKKVLLSVFLLLIMSGCQQVPDNLINAEKIQAENQSGFSENIVTEEDKGTAENEKNIDSDWTASNLTKDFQYVSKEGRTLSINAEINSNDAENKDIYSFNISRTDITNLLPEFAAAYFKEEKDNAEYNSEENVYTLADKNSDDYFTIRAVSNYLSISGHKKNLNPYNSNLYLSNDDIPDKFMNEQEAISLCENFCTALGLKNYHSDYFGYYGKVVGEPFCDIIMRMEADGIPIVSTKKIFECEFYVTEQEIYNVGCGFFEMQKSKKCDKSKFLSVNDAVHILENQLDNIIMRPRSSDIYEYKLNDKGILMDFNVVDISFEYIIHKSIEGWIAVPAWRFILGNNNIKDRSCILAVKAETGEVIFE